MKIYARELLYAAIAGLLMQPAVFGGRWELVAHVAPSDGHPAVAAGNLALAACVGEAIAAPHSANYTGGNLLSGYLSQIVSDPLGLLKLISTGTTFSSGQIAGALASDNVQLSFSTEVDTASVPGNIRVIELTDRLSGSVGATWYYTIADAGSNLTSDFGVIASSSVWNKGSTYELQVSTGVLDFNGEPMYAPMSSRFMVIRDHLKDNRAKVEGDSGTSVFIPAESYPAQDYFLNISTAADSQLAAADAQLAANGSPDRKLLKALSINAYDAANRQLAQTLAKDARVTLSYTADAKGILQGVQGGSALRAANLSVWWLNDAQNRWVKLSGATLDAANQQMYVYQNHFSTYSLVSQPDTDVSSVYAYPVPFRPNIGNPNRYGAWTDGISFTNLPSIGKVRIYTITAEKVRELDIATEGSNCAHESGSQCLRWDAKNSAGETVASGVYIWEVIAGENRKTGKLAVIK